MVPVQTIGQTDLDSLVLGSICHYFPELARLQIACLFSQHVTQGRFYRFAADIELAVLFFEDQLTV